MIDILLILATGLYLVVVALLFVYGLNFFYLTFLARRHSEPAPPELTPAFPRVTVQLPIYNELYVAERLIDAAAHLDYPRDLFEIQVLDDSTDETSEIVRAAVLRQQSRGLTIQAIRRDDRTGYKAGALANGLAHARGEFIAMFDADFVPRPDFILRTLPYFDDPNIAFVQARWDHVNRAYSPLTLLQSLCIDGHFVIEQFARSNAGFCFNFSGTAGVWRHTALQDAGGWKADTLTEDLDLSYRAFLRGWRGRYVRDIAVPAELPVTLSAYRRQQHRWAHGSLSCATKFIPRVWKSRFPLMVKLQATIHLTGYAIHILMFILALLFPALILLPVRYQTIHTLFGFAIIFNLTTFAPLLLTAAAQRQLGRSWREILPGILLLSAFGAGMTLNTVRAAIQIALGKQASFERTPKFGISHKAQSWSARKYQLRFDSIVFFEIAFAFYSLCTPAFAVSNGNWGIAAYSSLFCAGLMLTCATTIKQSLAVSLSGRRSTPTLAAPVSKSTLSVPERTLSVP